MLKKRKNISETSEHNEIKKIKTNLEKWYNGITINEYPNYGQEADAYHISYENHTILIEIIWTITWNQVLRDFDILQNSMDFIKIVVVNPKIFDKNEEDKRKHFDKLRISEIRKGYIVSELFDGLRILNDESYNIYLRDFINFSLTLVSRNEKYTQIHHDDIKDFVIIPLHVQRLRRQRRRRRRSGGPTGRSPASRRPPAISPAYLRARIRSRNAKGSAPRSKASNSASRSSRARRAPTARASPPGASRAPAPPRRPSSRRNPSSLSTPARPALGSDPRLDRRRVAARKPPPAEDDVGRAAPDAAAQPALRRSTSRAASRRGKAASAADDAEGVAGESPARRCRHDPSSPLAAPPPAAAAALAAGFSAGASPPAALLRLGAGGFAWPRLASARPSG